MVAIPRLVSRMFSDESLTKKAYLNAVAAALDYCAQLLVGFLVTPILVGSLGDHYYGTWRVLERLMGYLSPATGRPAQALKYTLANRQASADYEEKRRGVGSAVAIWALFLPPMGLLGGVLAWLAPYLLNAPPEAVWIVRLTAGILVANLALSGLVDVPRSVLEGENLGYKRMGLSVCLVFAGGGLTWLALHLDGGLVGVATASLIVTVLTGVLFLQVARQYASWFGVARPSAVAVRRFLGLSWWFLAWHLIMRLMMASDLVLLGLLGSTELVTTYSLTKYAPETVISIVGIVVFGIAPGLGGIIGSGDLKRAIQLRNEIMVFTWLIVTALGFTILLWSWRFISLWVGTQHFAGSLPMLLISIVVVQFVLIRNDGNIIDLTLRLERKVVIGALSVGLSLLFAAVLVSYFDLGIIGVCLGFIVGRSVLTVGYPLMVGRVLGVSLSTQIRGALKPALITLLLFLVASAMAEATRTSSPFNQMGWLSLALSVGFTSVLVLVLLFYTGLSSPQRQRILGRARIVIGMATGGQS